jgi:hypothetical protein
MKKLYSITLLLAALMAACASPGGDNSAPNNNAAPSQNASAQTAVPQTGTPLPSIDQNGASAPTRPAVIPEVAKVIENPSQPIAGQPAADGNAPKLLVPTREIDFGKQSKDIKLARSITIKNGGKTDLEIKSVSPS